MSHFHAHDAVNQAAEEWVLETPRVELLRHMRIIPYWRRLLEAFQI